MSAEAQFSMDIQRPGEIVVSVGMLVDTLRAWVRSKDLDGGDPRLSKHLCSIVSDISERGSELKLNIYTRDSRKEPRVLATVLDLSSDDINKFRIPGAKYISIELEDTGVQSGIWKVSKLSLIGTTGGGRR